MITRMMLRGRFSDVHELWRRVKTRRKVYETKEIASWTYKRRLRAASFCVLSCSSVACMRLQDAVDSAIQSLFATQDFEDIQAAAFLLFFLSGGSVHAFFFSGKPVGIGRSLLNHLLAFVAVNACLNELAATAAGIFYLAADSKLAILNHFGGNSQRCTCMFDNITCTAVWIGLYIFFYFYFVVPVSVVTFLTGSSTGIRI